MYHRTSINANITRLQCDKMAIDCVRIDMLIALQWIAFKSFPLSNIMFSFYLILSIFPSTYYNKLSFVFIFFSIISWSKQKSRPETKHNCLLFLRVRLNSLSTYDIKIETLFRLAPIHFSRRKYDSWDYFFMSNAWKNY